MVANLSCRQGGTMLLLAPRQVVARGQNLHDLETDVVTRACVLRTRIPKADNQMHEDALLEEADQRPQQVQQAEDEKDCHRYGSAGKAGPCQIAYVELSSEAIGQRRQCDTARVVPR